MLVIIYSWNNNQYYSPITIHPHIWKWYKIDSLFSNLDHFFAFSLPLTISKTLQKLPIPTARVFAFALQSQAIIMANTNSVSAPVVEEVKERIELTQIERSIFDRLLATLRHFGLTNFHLRVAGGWVRDKLLGKVCYDIDIALDNMLGSEFVDKVRDYLLSTGEQVQGVAVIPWYYYKC